MFDWSLRVPCGYAERYKTLREVEADLLEHYHPEYVRRVLAWFHHKGGTIGPGGLWRAGGAQPDKPGFAPEGRSFHQDQPYADGFVGACAIDLVAPDGPDANLSHDGVSWAMTIPQGSEEAERWGLHCNVGFPPTGEPWHLQPIEIDGWSTWWHNGRPAPQAGYPIPPEHDPYRVEVVEPAPPPAPAPEPPELPEEDMMEVIQVDGDVTQYIRSGFTARWAETGPEKQRDAATLGFDPKPRLVDRTFLKSLVLVGPQPQGENVTTSYRDFGGHVA